MKVPQANHWARQDELALDLSGLLLRDLAALAGKAGHFAGCELELLDQTIGCSTHTDHLWNQTHSLTTVLFDRRFGTI